MLDAQQSLDVAALAVLGISPGNEERRFDPGQKRDPDGKWGDGVPGPSLPDLDMEGFSLISEAEGTFGTVRMGVDDAGDVRMAFHEGREARAVDLSSDEVADLSDILDRLAAYRDEELPDDADPTGVYDDDRFGYDNAHYVALHGNGTISITFGAEDDNPWRLVLDPPYEADPGDPDDEDIDDVQAVLDAIDDVLNETGTRSGGHALTERKFNPSQPRDPGGEGGGQWVSSPGSAAKDALEDILNLASRIDLDPEDQLVSSSKFSDGFGDRDLVFAVTHGPENTVRIGLVHPEDAGRWKGANKGGTAILNAEELHKLRSDLAEGSTKAKAAAKAADKAWDSGNGPTDPVLLGEEAVAEGRLRTFYADLGWDIYLNDAEPTSWNVEIRTVSDQLGESDPIRLDPKKTRALLNHLDGIQTQLDASEPSRSASLKGGRMDARYNDQHAPAGSSNGGQFVAGGGGGGGSEKKPTTKNPSHGRLGHRHPTQHKDDGTLSYDPGSDHGTGYDSKGGDDRVHALQQALNRLGIKDSSGKALKDDGRLGPKTTSSVKKLQKLLGLKPDGKVTPDLLKRITSMKSLPQRRSASMAVCVRSFGFEPIELRSSDGRTLEGYAAVFNSPTTIRDLQGDFEETILPGAFKRTLAQRTPLLQWDHGKDPRIGTAPIGDIEELREDDHGLYVRASLYDHPDIERIRMAIAGRSVRGMSFRFGVPAGGDDWPTRDRRNIRDLDAYELGPVAFPAYDSTSVHVRSLLAQLDPDEHRSLLRELAEELRLAVDLSDLTGASGARSADRGDLDLQPSSGARSALSPEIRSLEAEALHALGVL